MSYADRLEREGWSIWTDEDLSYYASSLAGDRETARWFEASIRRSASPAAAAQLLRMNTYVDVRAVLSQVPVPTLVIQALDDRDVDVRDGRYLAERIPNAKYVELPNRDPTWFVPQHHEIIGDVQEILTVPR